MSKLEIYLDLLSKIEWVENLHLPIHTIITYDIDEIFDTEEFLNDQTVKTLRKIQQIFKIVEHKHVINAIKSDLESIDSRFESIITLFENREMEQARSLFHGLSPNHQRDFKNYFETLYYYEMHDEGSTLSEYYEYMGI